MGSSLGEKIGSAYGVTLVPVLLQLTIAVLVFLQLITAVMFAKSSAIHRVDHSRDCRDSSLY